MTSPKDTSNRDGNQVDDELKDMLFAQHQSGGSIDIIVTSETKKEHRVPVHDSNTLQADDHQPTTNFAANPLLGGQDNSDQYQIPTTGEDGDILSGYKARQDTATER